VLKVLLAQTLGLAVNKRMIVKVHAITLDQMGAINSPTSALPKINENVGQESKQTNICDSSFCINTGTNNQNLCLHGATCTNSGTNSRVISAGDVCDNQGTNTQVICLHGRVLTRPN
jgi:hypothetical protein